MVTQILQPKDIVTAINGNAISYYDEAQTKHYGVLKAKIFLLR